MFLDTSIIIEMMISPRGSERFEEIFEIVKFKDVYISIIQLGEVSDWCLKNNVDPHEVISSIKDICTLVPLSEEVVLAGSKLKSERRKARKNKFSLMDGLIMASARSINQKLLTLDADFSDLEDVIQLSSE